MSASNKKFVILACLLALMIGAGIVCYVVFYTAQGTVRDFSVFPYPLHTANKIVLSHGQTSFEMSQVKLPKGMTWQITSPIQAPLSDWGLSILLRLSKTPTIFIDTREPAHDIQAATDHRRLAPQDEVVATFMRDNQVIARVTFGSGKREATANAERRWVFVEGDDTAYRVFTPLYDIGEPFLAPMRVWRNTQVLPLDTHQIEAIQYHTRQDDITLDRKGDARSNNAQGWRLASATGNGISQESLKDFQIDARRVATILELVAPLYADDYGDGIEWSSIAPNGADATITLQTQEHAHILEIGPEVDPAQWPAYATLGEGTRFARIAGDTQVFVLTARRLLGMMPSLSDLRDKQVWQLLTNVLSAIEGTSQGQTIRYRPAEEGKWVAEVDSKIFDVHENGLIALVKGLSKLEATRYATAEENHVTLEAATILIYENGDKTPAHRLVMGAPVEGVMRFAKADEGTLFVLSEPFAKMLLNDIRILTNAHE